MIDVLFLVKDKDKSNINKQTRGILLTAENNSKYLNSINIKSKVISVKSADYIDTVIKENKPRIVIIETIWVSINHLRNIVSNNIIEKLIVRIHSDVPYFSIETIGFRWINDFLSLPNNVYLASNSVNFSNSLSRLYDKEIYYLPNLYDYEYSFKHREQSNVLNVGIFGAIRLLKNTLTGVIASIIFAKENNKKLNLYINNLTSDIGNNVLLNIKMLLNDYPNVKLFINPYLDGDKYKNLIQSLDLGLQLSFSETFNNVAGDFVNNGVPIIYNDEIDWLKTSLKVSSTNINEIVSIISKAYSLRNNENFLNGQYNNLKEYNKRASNIWLDFYKKINSSNA